MNQLDRRYYIKQIYYCGHPTKDQKTNNPILACLHTGKARLTKTTNETTPLMIMSKIL